MSKPRIKRGNTREKEIADYTAWKKQIREEYSCLKKEALATIPPGEDAAVVLEEPVVVCPWF